MYYQYSVTLTVYGLTPGEKIVLKSLFIISISLFHRLVLVFVVAGINALIMLSRDQPLIYSFLICSGLLIRTLFRALAGVSTNSTNRNGVSWQALEFKDQTNLIGSRLEIYC